MTQAPDRPWHKPGKWLVNPAYWEDEAKAARPHMPKRIHSSRPTKTPPAIVARLNEEIVKVLRGPTLRERLARVSVDAVGSTPKEFGAFIRVEMDEWAKAVKESGAKVE